MELNRPVSEDAFELVEILLFVLYQRNVVCITMATFRVVEHLYVIEDVPASFFSVSGKVAFNQRPAFRKMPGQIRQSETLIVSKLDRLGCEARSVTDLLKVRQMSDFAKMSKISRGG